MDIRKVKKLIELIDETGVMEIEIKEGEESVRISRGSTQIATSSPQIFTTPVPPPPLTQTLAHRWQKHLGKQLKMIML